MDMCMYVHVKTSESVYICMYIHICVYVPVQVYVHLCANAPIHVYACLYAYVYDDVQIPIAVSYVYAYICM